MKTKASERTLPLLPEIKTLLQKKQEQIQNNMSTFGKQYNKTFLDYVCVNNLGERIKPRTLYTNFVKCAKKHKLPHIRFHDLRHSSASILVSNKMSIKTIQEWLGHANYKTTANVYAHTNYCLKRECCDKIQDLLFDFIFVDFLTLWQLSIINVLINKANCLQNGFQA